MANFECCKTKPFPASYYICINCFKIYHRSCAQKNKKSFTFVRNFQITCCDKPDQSEFEEKNILERTVCELEESNEMKDAHIEKILKKYELFLSEVQQREDEALRQQNELIASANNEIFKLKKIIENTEKPKKTLSTQTESLAKTVATQSESTDCGNKRENLEQTEDINRVNTILSKKEATKISNNKESNSSNINNKNRILIVAGAHGKNLIGHLSRQKKEHQMIESILMTNCSNELLVGTAIKESKNYTTSDTLIIWTNRINVSIVNKLASQTNTNIIIITEPYRYDNKDKNLDIYENNLSLQNDLFHKRANHMNILECNNILRQTNYERNGLQISSFGKLFLSRAILNLIESNPKC
ncbi:hypothetical protein JTB14_007072 [Gonioctena quinquepunctata]|nr:hypothetical protein JTB14_007072 [Gonioctena quinquepunctata]